MLKIFNDLFKDLNKNDIKFCCWKDQHNLKNYLNGQGDLDIYIPINFEDRFKMIAKRNGFRLLISYQANHKNIEHYYALDQIVHKFVHMHVYFKIITGEHATKNYDLPIGKYIFNNLTHSTYLPILNTSCRRNIFLIRYFLKVGSIYGLLQYFRDLSKYKDEWDSFSEEDISQDITELGLSIDDLNKMHSVYLNQSLLKNFLMAIKVKRKLKKYRIRSFFKYQTFVIINLLLRLFNKLFFKKKKLLNPGLVVAICGIDGTGKSSLVSFLNKKFSLHFNTTILHLGRPNSNIYTFFFNIFIKAYSYSKIIYKKHKKKTAIKTLKKINQIYLFRSVLLAYDRKKQSEKAFKLSKTGSLVICDRYPGLEIGKMDSPRIPYDKHKGFIYQLCHKLEQNLYRSIKPSELVFHLFLPIEEIIHRNNLRSKFGKETERELRERYDLNSKTIFLGENYYMIDSSFKFEDVANNIINRIWHNKNW